MTAISVMRKATTMTTMTTLETLRAARKLITPRLRWTQGAYNRTKWQREQTRPDDPKAYAHCAMGAIHTVTNGHVVRGIVVELNRTVQDDSLNGIIGFNDSHSHKEVLAAFDETIERLENSDD